LKCSRNGANADQAKAEFRDSVLEVRVPIPEQPSRRRQIPITGAGRSEGSSGNTATNEGGATGKER